MSEQKTNNPIFVQLVKFGLIGVLNTLVDNLVFAVLILIFGVGDEQVLLIGLFTLMAYACGVFNSFMLNTRWTFRKEYGRTKREMVSFVVVNLISWGLSFLLVWLFSNYVFSGSGITEWVCGLINFTGAEQVNKVVSILAKLCATPFVIIVNFLGSKIFVFTDKK